MRLRPLVIVLIVLTAGCGGPETSSISDDPTQTTEPTATPTPTETPIETNAPTETDTSTPTPTPTTTPTPTPTPAPTFNETNFVKTLEMNDTVVEIFESNESVYLLTYHIEPTVKHNFTRELSVIKSAWLQFQPAHNNTEDGLYVKKVTPRKQYLRGEYVAAGTVNRTLWIRTEWANAYLDGYLTEEEFDSRVAGTIKEPSVKGLIYVERSSFGRNTSADQEHGDRKGYTAKAWVQNDNDVNATVTVQAHFEYDDVDGERHGGTLAEKTAVVPPESDVEVEWTFAIDRTLRNHSHSIEMIDVNID